MTGFYLKCLITIWMVAPGFKTEMPHITKSTCKVIVEETYAIKTETPGYYYIDCVEDLGWLKTSTNLKMWIPKDQCND